jgi:NitT/TauT family transport system ATP-binding protein
MSKRPGKIIEEIVIDLPAREDPFVRRNSPRMGQYIQHLSDLLDLAHADV